MRTSAGNSYSKIVDIWALGAVVHKILTSEIPFLDKYEDPEMSGLDSGYATSTDVDIGLLSDYCRKSQPFPTESLLTNKASKDAIDFVTSMMVADPRGRVSAAAALNSGWLREIELVILLPLLFPDILLTWAVGFPARMFRPARAIVCLSLTRNPSSLIDIVERRSILCNVNFALPILNDGQLGPWQVARLTSFAVDIDCMFCPRQCLLMADGEVLILPALLDNIGGKYFPPGGPGFLACSVLTSFH